MQRFIALVGATLLALWGAAPAMAQPVEPGAGLRLSGFGTLGLAHVEAPAGWGYRRDIDQPAHGGGTRADIDSRIGVRAQYVVSAQVDVVAQAVVRRHAPGGDAADGIEWAYAAWRPRPDVALRLGRISQDLFLLSEYRDVGFAYPFVRPPAEFYGFVIGPLDGIDATKSWSEGGVQWRLKVISGRSVSVPLVTVRTQGFVLSREADGLLLRLAAGRVSIASRPAVVTSLLDALSALQGVPVPQVAAESALLGQRLQSLVSAFPYLTVGANLERGNWLFMAEATQVYGHNTAAFPSGRAVTLGHRSGALTLFGGLSRSLAPYPAQAEPDWQAALAPVVGDAAARQLQGVGRAAAGLVNRPVGNQRSRSLGLRWDVGSSTALKLQNDWVRTGPHGNALWGRADASPARATVTSVTLDFLF